MNKCLICGAVALTESRKDLPYAALPGTTLVGILVQECAQCGERFEHVPAIGLLNDALASTLVRKEARLTGHEVRFLRKYLDLSATELARRMRVTKETMSRWETSARPISPQNDLLLRLIVASQLRLDGFASELDHVAVADPTPLASTASWVRQAWAVAA